MRAMLSDLCCWSLANGPVNGCCALEGSYSQQFSLWHSWKKEFHHEGSLVFRWVQPVLNDDTLYVLYVKFVDFAGIAAAALMRHQQRTPMCQGNLQLDLSEEEQDMPWGRCMPRQGRAGSFAAKVSLWRLANVGYKSAEMFFDSPGDEGEWLHGTCFSGAENISQSVWNPLTLPIAGGVAV